MIEGDPPSPERFRPNARFAALMHRVIATAGPHDFELQAAARAQREGWVYVVDLRTPEGPGGRVPPEDIIGGFEVQDGKLLADSYWANDDHRLLTEHGLVELPPALRQAVVDAVGSVG